MQRAFFGDGSTFRAVPNANTIQSWVRRLEETGTTLRRGTHDRRRSIRTPENVQLVRAAIEQSPGRSARKHAFALGMSCSSLRRIFYLDLQFHPYKMMLAHELSVADYPNHRNLYEQMLAQFPPAAVFFSSNKAHFHLSGAVIKQGSK
ncbi:Hypothetical predicted protein [Pelobates cultripes]|uniref:DUF4817 domain-containing protein n=1 Tax=Pelobates cultripes TaxID=61616 RepID=A0AAD1RM62_PELCU|nr:Hypothetical predicted protein [Pelobates cultripes]